MPCRQDNAGKLPRRRIIKLDSSSRPSSHSIAKALEGQATHASAPAPGLTPSRPLQAPRPRYHAMTTLPLLIRREGHADAEAIERLHERAFGPGRFARTAFRLREGAGARPDLCFTAQVGTYLVGSIRLSPVVMGDAPGLMLGPVAVEPAFMSRGIGYQLIAASLDAAREAGDRRVILVGDESYYARSGFTKVPPGRLALPGPVDPQRLLWLELMPGAFEGVSGAVRPSRA
ncbi:Predicted N-acetyltransferase YhbS [Rhizobiales bacterium GAS113]|nr:Predicted N-acetyltransferase YhbS [Rhizobiales bacterium GAS113]